MINKGVLIGFVLASSLAAAQPTFAQEAPTQPCALQVAVSNGDVSSFNDQSLEVVVQHINNCPNADPPAS